MRVKKSEYVCNGCKKINFFNPKIEDKPKWCQYCLKVFY